MKLYVNDKNGKKRKIKAIYKRIDEKDVKFKRNSPEYFAAVTEGIRQGVIYLGT